MKLRIAGTPDPACNHCEGTGIIDAVYHNAGDPCPCTIENDPNPTLSEIKELKGILEAEITGKIIEFRLATLLMPESIELETLNVGTMEDPERIEGCRVRVIVSLP